MQKCKLLFTTFLGVAACSPAAGFEITEMFTIFDTVCVNAQFEKLRIERLAQAVASMGSFELKAITDRNLIIFNDLSGTKAAWALIKRPSYVLIQYGEKDADKKTSKSCTITVQNIDPNVVRSLLERDYPVKFLHEGKQGTTSFRIYSAELVGYADKVSIAILSMAAPPDPFSATSLTVFETSGFGNVN